MTEPTSLQEMLYLIESYRCAGGRVEHTRKFADMQAGLLAVFARLEASHQALENVRILASKSRKEPWAEHMLRFCEAASVRPNVLRENPSE